MLNSQSHPCLHMEHSNLAEQISVTVDTGRSGLARSGTMHGLGVIECGA